MGKLIFICILIFIFLDSKMEDKWFHLYQFYQKDWSIVQEMHSCCYAAYLKLFFTWLTCSQTPGKIIYSCMWCNVSNVEGLYYQQICSWSRCTSCCMMNEYFEDWMNGNIFLPKWSIPFPSYGQITLIFNLQLSISHLNSSFLTWCSCVTNVL
jgi:hypothetical protein